MCLYKSCGLDHIKWTANVSNNATALFANQYNKFEWIIIWAHICICFFVCVNLSKIGKITLAVHTNWNNITLNGRKGIPTIQHTYMGSFAVQGYILSESIGNLFDLQLPFMMNAFETFYNTQWMQPNHIITNWISFFFLQELFSVFICGYLSPSFTRSVCACVHACMCVYVTHSKCSIVHFHDYCFIFNWINLIALLNSAITRKIPI